MCRGGLAAVCGAVRRNLRDLRSFPTGALARWLLLRRAYAVRGVCRRAGRRGAPRRGLAGAPWPMGASRQPDALAGADDQPRCLGSSLDEAVPDREQGELRLIRHAELLFDVVKMSADRGGGQLQVVGNA